MANKQMEHRKYVVAAEGYLHAARLAARRKRASFTVGFGPRRLYTIRGLSDSRNSRSLSSACDNLA